MCLSSSPLGFCLTKLSCLNCLTYDLICKNIIVDHEACEIIRLVASVHPSVCPSMLPHLNRFPTGAEWSILVLGFAMYSKRSSEKQVSYTLKNIIECSSQGAFKMVGCSKWLLFRQVAPSRSIMLLIVGAFGAESLDYQLT